VTYLRIGDWNVHVNGLQLKLEIRRIDEIGRINGRLDGHPISGWWNERGHRLTFVVDANGEHSSNDQAFTGYAWDQPATGPRLQRTYHLAGSYDTFGGGGGAKDRETFGWFATLERLELAHIGEQLRSTRAHALGSPSEMARVEFRQMNDDEAREIASWRYDPPYEFYDADADADDLALLLSRKHREGRYFAACLGAHLVGFFGFRCEGDDVVVGLGLRPDLTGRGLGRSFLEAGLEFARSRYAPSRFRLSVASFNTRAIVVYMRAGFVPQRVFDHETNGGVYPFIEMTRPA
jgi:ribosomal-protein-alanine N-acetyltransferase